MTFSAAVESTRRATIRSMVDARLSMWQIKKRIWPDDRQASRPTSVLHLGVDKPLESLLSLPGVQVTELELPAAGALRGVSIWVTDRVGSLAVRATFVRSHATPESVSQFMNLVVDILRAGVVQPDRVLTEVARCRTEEQPTTIGRH
jgi:hypothetical protein